MDKLGPYLLGPNDENQGVYCGDARELAPAIPDKSVDLIFTDPVYQNIKDYQWLAKISKRILRPRKSVLAFCAHTKEVEAGRVMLPYLRPGTILQHTVVASRGRLFSHSLQCNTQPCLWFSKGLPDSKWQFIEINSPIPEPRGHKWGKAVSAIWYRIEHFTDVGDIVIDPFCGGGTVPAVCKMLSRHWLAFEIDPDTAETARQRIRQTQPPLFTLPQAGQLAMEGIS